MQNFIRKNFRRKGYIILSLLVAVAIFVSSIQFVSARLATSPVGDLEDGSALLPTGQVITPAAAPGSTFAALATGLRADGNADAAEAVTTALSPDGKTLLVLTSGYNQNFRDAQTGEFFTYPVLDPQTGEPSEVTTQSMNFHVGWAMPTLQNYLLFALKCTNCYNYIFT